MSVFRFEEFTFDSGSRLLLHNGVERRLSPKAVELLSLLLKARPRALSREEIYDALWPSTFVCETNMANVVNDLRRALGDHARGSSYIRTVHGFGYSFCGKVATAPLPAIAAVMRCEECDHPLFAGDNVVGRVSDARVVLLHGSVSRRHAVIRIHEGTITIADLGSTNGTYVDGERIDSLPVRLTRDSVIGLGARIASVAPRDKVISTTKLLLNMPQLRREIAERMSNA